MVPAGSASVRVLRASAWVAVAARAGRVEAQPQGFGGGCPHAERAPALAVEG